MAAILGKLLKKGIRLGESLEQDYSSPIDLQKAELRKLLIAARNTAFGKHHYFDTILNGFKIQNNESFYDYFKSNVPIFTYDDIYEQWWSKSLEGHKNICWPNKIKHYALSSGTSGSTSKFIPVSPQMIKSIQRTSIRQILTLSKYDLPDEFYGKGILMVGGCTDLKYNGKYFAGDLSGITASQLPVWFQHFYKPGKKISKTPNWEEKLNEMVEKAKDWDIGIIGGVPAWIQILIERIIKHYGLNDIHDIWPNLHVFVHGGVSFEPYKKGFEKLLGRKLIYMETYLASEGFIAFQATPHQPSMRMVLNNGIFYEFIPFNRQNFDETGELKENPQTLRVDEIEEGKEYAILLSTNAGAWRYLIGDVIKLISKEQSEIAITGRTKHFLSLCGEHLSLDNMNKAIELISSDFDLDIKEFTVSGEKYDTLFAHHWYIGTNEKIDSEEFKMRLDEHLKSLNDDYEVERSAALKDVIVEIVPIQLFYDWMKNQGKTGGQNKFPRVLNEQKLNSWKQFLTENYQSN